MFGRRSDATEVKSLSQMRRFMPFISPRRNDSVFYYPMEVQAEPALAFLEEFNRKQPEDQQLTLFHLVLRSLAMMFRDYPDVNRFVMGGRYWQRDGIWVTFSAKRSLDIDAPMLTIKRRFIEGESLEEMAAGIVKPLRSQRKGKKTQSDKEVNLALKLPVFMIGLAVKALHFGNKMGILPRSLIDGDPMFTSVFVGNVGSVGLKGGFHHVWEYGTCSHFVVMGQLRERDDGKQVFDLGFTYDERVEGGLYAGLVLDAIQRRIEDPEQLR
jgi:hypothetical protein